MTANTAPSGCHECPFLYDSTWCRHPDEDACASPDEVSLGFDQECAPKTCPLRKGPVTITLTQLRVPMEL